MKACCIGMQLAVRGKALDRRHPAVLRRYCKRQARQHAPAVEMHRAGAALAVVASLCAGKFQVLAQQVEQRGAHVHAQLMVLAVDVQCDIGRLANIPYRTGPAWALDVRAMTGAAAVESVAIKNSRRSGMIPQMMLSLGALPPERR